MHPTTRLLRSRILTMAAQLVSLPEVERLSPICIRILGGNPSKFTLQGTNTYLVGSGPRRLLIDTGEGNPSWIAALRRTLAEEKASISATLITHWHGDHVGGIRDVAILSREAGWETKVYKNQPDKGQLEIKDGQRFEVDGATLTAHHTPGHTVDHMALVLREEDAMFTGDNVLGQGTAVFEDLATYLSSLKKMGGLFQGHGYPGHGPVVEDGPAKIREYIAHRQQREEQVTSTLRTLNDRAGKAAWAPMELVKVVYADIPENLHTPAQGGMVQVLQKLEKEGRAYQEDGRWVLRDRSAL